MFILRRVQPNGVQQNITLGNQYTIVGRHESYEEFCKWFQNVFYYPHTADLDDKSDENTRYCCMFILGLNPIPIYYNDTVYIMTESGSTFTRIDTLESVYPETVI